MRINVTVAKLFMLGMGLLGVVAISPATAGDIYVITHPSVALTEGELKSVYLGEKQFVGALKLVPVDNAVAQGDFLAKVINMRADKYAALWTKKSFRGDATPPATKSGDADVIRFVKSTPGAVGYVTAPAQGIKELYRY